MDIQQILDCLSADARKGEVVFSTHAAVAMRVQKLLGEECSTADLVKLISAEPVLSSRIVRMANSMAFNPRSQAVTDLKTAVTRLGFSSLRAITSAVIVRQMEEMSKQGGRADIATSLWDHTTHVAALARVLAKRVTRQNPDEAFFAGVVHEVGAFYMLSRASEFPDLLSDGIELWHGEGQSAVGRAVLSTLGVPANVIEAMEVVWAGYLAMPPISLGDTLLLADELSPVESPLDALVGMSRVGMDVELDILIDSETLSLILQESAEEVASLSAALHG